MYYTILMIKLILFDGDGVVMKNRDKFFSQRLAQKQGLPLETILPFFKNEFKECTVGRADLKEELPKYFEIWKWRGTVDELLEFWFDGEKEFDEKVIAEIENHRKNGIKIGLVSDNEKYRGEYLLKDVGLAKYFDYIFLSCEIGMNKSNPEFFKKIIEVTGFAPNEIQYWDDDQENIDTARNLGIEAKLFCPAGRS
jgi:putative hydrolase of the HAD superfamily